MEAQPNPQVTERYDNLIAYPEGGLGYEHDVLSLQEFAWVMKQQAAAMAHNLTILKRDIPPSVTEILELDDVDLHNIQLRKGFTWGEIGDFLDGITHDYLREAYALTSANALGASSPSE